MPEMIAGIPFVFIAPLVSGTAFVVAASVVRRRFGPWALLAMTVVGIALAVEFVARLYWLDLLLTAPVIPGCAVAAGVVEWRARRAGQARLWRHVAWGITALALVSVAVLALVFSNFKCTGCVF